MKIETIKPKTPAFPAIDFVTEYNKIAKDYRNVIAFFEQDKNLVYSIAFNSLYQRCVFVRSMPWRECQDPDNGTEWTDNDTRALIRHAGDHYGVIFTAEVVDQAIAMLAQERVFCPIRRYLDSLVWDGVPRIQSALHDFLGVEFNAYTMGVSTLFFRALAARVYQAGCKFDHVIVLQGGQCIGKSSFLRILGGDWYSDGIRKFEGKEAIEALQGVLIGEIPELQGFSKAEVEEIKAFITRTEDRARMAYGRRTESFPRRTVFVGTTNADDYLRDATGNRRFFPVICTKALCFEALLNAREQLFAEAVARYKSDPSNPLMLQGDEALRLARLAQEGAMYTDPWEDIIISWLDEKVRTDYWDCEAGMLGISQEWIQRDRVATCELFDECLKLPIERLNDQASKRIANIMRKIGWERGNYRFGKRYPKMRGYLRPTS